MSDENAAVAEALAAGQVRVIFELEQEDGFPPTDRERLWAQAIGTNAYELLNTPFFVRGISKGDHVEAFERDGELFFGRVLHGSHHSTIRVIVYEHEQLDHILTTLDGLGCACEQAVEWNPHFVAVDIPPTADLGKVQAFLTDASRAKVTGFEEGNLVHPGALGTPDDYS